MSQVDLKAARRVAGWTQQKAATRIGVSQPYYSQLESGTRSMPAELAATAVRILRLSPLFLPLPAFASELSVVAPDELAAALARLGYPGFTHMAKARTAVNPAELVVRALAHADLDPRIIEGLPWALSAFHDLDWSWLVAQSRLLNLQNRLGFLVTLAGQLAKPGTEDQLRTAVVSLESSRLAVEGTLCRESMSQAERAWVREHRTPDAAHWNLLTTLSVEHLTHAA